VFRGARDHLMRPAAEAAEDRQGPYILRRCWSGAAHRNDRRYEALVLVIDDLA